MAKKKKQELEVVGVDAQETSAVAVIVPVIPKPICPKCRNTAQRVRPGVWQCKPCKAEFTRDYAEWHKDELAKSRMRPRSPMMREKTVLQNIAK